MDLSTTTKETLILSLLKGVGPQTIKSLFKVFRSIDELRGSGVERIKQALNGRNANAVFEQLKDERSLQNAYRKCSAILENCNALGISIVTITDPLYPRNLALITDAPPVLYFRGAPHSLQGTSCIAVVGTRKPTSNGLEVSRRISVKFSEYGFTVASGLAEGIDTAAHLGALEGGGVTVGVLGTSVEESEIYPKSNVSLVERILENQGSIVSEIAPGHKAERRDFAKRDRIQSGLSLAVFPIESDTSGGTMQTVNYALIQGRPLFCPKPAHAEAPQARGINQLLDVDKVALCIRSKEEYPVIAKVLKELEANLHTISAPDASVLKIESELDEVEISVIQEKLAYFRNARNVVPRPNLKKKAKLMLGKKQQKSVELLLKELREIIEELKAQGANRDANVTSVVVSLLKGLQ